jgi:TolB-like protein
VQEDSKYRSSPLAPLGDRNRGIARGQTFPTAPSSLHKRNVTASCERPPYITAWPKPVGERIESVVALRFGAFEVDLGARELRKNGVSLKLQEKPFQILELLVTRAGEVVARKELQEKLWPSSFVCFDRSINTGVNKLRQTLGDSVRHPRYIETRSRRGYRFIAPLEPGGLARGSGASRGDGIDSIAVLPFQSASSNPEMEYLSDGITESIINSLSQLPGIRVMARSTVLRYKGRDVDPQNVGRDLRTRAVLTGRVVQRDGNLAIDAELVDVDNGWRLWGEQYNPKASDILAVQEEISRKISERLHLSLRAEA